MKRLKIMKAYAVLWLFIYFLVNSNMEAMTTFFFATLTFNIAVFTVLTIGIIVIMRSSISLIMLAGTFGTLAYKKDNIAFYLQGIDKIMPANIAHMFHSRAEKGVLLFTSEESRAVVEWIDEKFSNQNRYINYFIGTSLMIGLLGTFTGLLVAIDQMGKIILSLTGDIDLGEVIRSFAGPLGGMATGFGSSLFGVISAIILGLMGYILNKNQETLIEGVEDWLKGRIIDSAGAGMAVAPAMSGVPAAGGELPEQRNSFLDVFIDNISSLTKEMAKISQTNERLHSITIASVQQTRDEHEMSYELFETINANLVNIDETTKNSTTVLDQRLTNIENVVTNGQKLVMQELKETIEKLSTTLIEVLNANSETINEQSNNIKTLLSSLDEKLQAQLSILSNDDHKERLENLQNELQSLATILTNSQDSQSQNFKDVISSLAALTEKLTQEMTHLESLEKLSKHQITDIRKQNKVIEDVNESIGTASEKQLKQQELALNAHLDSQELLEKQRAILDLLVGKNDENLEELRRISSTSGGVSEAIDERVDANSKKSNGFFSKIFG